MPAVRILKKNIGSRARFDARCCGRIERRSRFDSRSLS
jgi:hypothetical protein